jgi:hypothetical protein
MHILALQPSLMSIMLDDDPISDADRQRWDVLPLAGGVLVGRDACQ